MSVWIISNSSGLLWMVRRECWNKRRNPQNKSKVTFDLSELVMQTDMVHTKCKLLIYQIYGMQSKGEKKERSAERNSQHDLAERS